MFTYCFKLIWGWGIWKWLPVIVFKKIYGFHCIFAFFAFLHCFWKMEICSPKSTLKINFLQHMSKQNLNYLSKTTFWKILECISLKVWATGSLQIFANTCKFASHFCNKKNIFCFLLNFVKWLHHTPYFLQFQICILFYPAS